MKTVKALRDCYHHGIYYHMGQIYELPDSEELPRHLVVVNADDYVPTEEVEVVKKVKKEPKKIIKRKLKNTHG